MPLEGHWHKVNTPLRQLTRREVRVVALAVTLTLAVVLAVVIASLGSPAQKLAPGCIDSIVPGRMGADSVRACGPRARAICTAHVNRGDPGSLAIEASCLKAGIS